MPTIPQRAPAAPRLIVAPSVGQPVALSGIARLLLELRQQRVRPALTLVTTPANDEPSSAVPSVE